jgi:hypothetical protein
VTAASPEPTPIGFLSLTRAQHQCPNSFHRSGVRLSTQGHRQTDTNPKGLSPRLGPFGPPFSFRGSFTLVGLSEDLPAALGAFATTGALSVSLWLDLLPRHDGLSPSPSGVFGLSTRLTSVSQGATPKGVATPRGLSVEHCGLSCKTLGFLSRHLMPVKATKACRLPP